MRSLFDLQIDYFIPLWRRLVLVAICFGWGLFEFFVAVPFWGFVFCALGVLATWQFFFDGWPASVVAKTERGVRDDDGDSSTSG